MMKKCDYLSKYEINILLNSIYKNLIYFKEEGKVKGLCHCVWKSTHKRKSCKFINYMKSNLPFYHRFYLYIMGYLRDSEWWWSRGYYFDNNRLNIDKWYKPRIKFIKKLAKVNGVELKEN